MRKYITTKDLLVKWSYLLSILEGETTVAISDSDMIDGALAMLSNNFIERELPFYPLESKMLSLLSISSSHFHNSIKCISVITYLASPVYFNIYIHNTQKSYHSNLIGIFSKLYKL